MDSILISVKKMLGISNEYDHFDQDILICINSVFSALIQLGVGPPEGFIVNDENAVWSDFMGNDARLEMVKSYTYLKVKLLFDPPLGSALIEAINRQISEIEWRISIASDNCRKEEDYYRRDIEQLKEDVELLKQHDILSIPLNNGGD